MLGLLLLLRSSLVLELLLLLVYVPHFPFHVRIRCLFVLAFTFAMRLDRQADGVMVAAGRTYHPRLDVLIWW